MKTLARALCVLLLASRLAAWELISTDGLIAQSDVIVIGKLANVMRAERGPDATDHGYIQAYEILKGEVPDGLGVVLTFPGQRGTVGPDGTFRSSLTGRDLRYEEGLEACWLLKRVAGTDSFEASHPARVQPYPFYDEIRAKARAPKK